ncbi:hypothetical protein [Dickeya phage Sucellus]|nr:hypothetical protein [Dickeya phage Sucellus]
MKPLLKKLKKIDGEYSPSDRSAAFRSMVKRLGLRPSVIAASTGRKPQTVRCWLMQEPARVIPNSTYIQLCIDNGIDPDTGDYK